MWPSPVEQAGGGVESDPARAGQIDFGPGVEIGEVGFGSGRAAIDRLHVGGQLDQVAGDEARGEAELAANLDEQPGRVAARTALELERFLDRLHARLQAHDVVDFVVDEAVEIDEEVDRVALAARESCAETSAGAARAVRARGRA